MRNNEKKAISIIVGVLVLVLCASLYFWVKGSEFEDNAVIIIRDTSTTTSTELTDLPITSTSKKRDTVTTVSKKTKTNTKTKSVKKPISPKNDSESENTETETETEPLWININTAGAEDFEMLTGIGEEIAERIIEYRENNGEFNNIEEIMNVKGIGEKKFMDICNYIYVDNPIYETETEIEAETEPETELQTSESLTEQITTELSTAVVIIETSEVTETITEDEVPESEPPTVELTENIFPIDLNSAEKEDLMNLPYVTEEVAEKIIELRDDLQGFNNEYELLYIEELEQKELSEIIKFVTVGQ